ncbi:MAG: RNA-binding protein [Nanoarchaeota archaeon]|jgi:RNA recognition motif-containing protein|nr:RNA-binding protein [Nanoarchaeota archaeon]
MSKKLFIGNLDFKTADKDLEDMFSGYGDINDCVIIKDRETGRSKGFGFVTFDDDEAAEKAVEGLNEKEVRGRKLTVNIAKEREESTPRFNNNPRFERRESEPEDEYSKYFTTTLMRD